MFDAPPKPGLPPAEIVRRIEKALHHAGDTHTWEDVRERIVTGEARAIWNDHGVWIVEVMQAPQKRWLNVWIVAGQLPEVMDLQEQVERFALDHGCEFLRAECRPGWRAILPDRGWRPKATVWTKEIER